MFSTKQLLSLQKLNRGLRDVQHELCKIGLWSPSSRLLKVNIYLCPPPRIEKVGFFMHEAVGLYKLFGYKEGAIYIPRFTWSNLTLLPFNSLRDVLRHEYSHAFAHHYYELIDTEGFARVFGGSYDHGRPIEMPREAFLTDYAATQPMEDFAETFMAYVKYRSISPRWLTNKTLLAKWKFINKITVPASKR